MTKIEISYIIPKPVIDITINNIKYDLTEMQAVHLLDVLVKCYPTRARDIIQMMDNKQLLAKSLQSSLP